MRIGRTALLRATGMGCLQLVKHLLQLGADPGVVNSSSRKPLTGAGEVSGQPQFESLYPRLLMASQPQHLVHQPWAQAAVVHCGRVSPVVEQELHHAQVAVPCGHEEGGPPAHIPRLEVDVGLAELEEDPPPPCHPRQPTSAGCSRPRSGRWGPHHWPAGLWQDCPKFNMSWSRRTAFPQCTAQEKSPAKQVCKKWQGDQDWNPNNRRREGKELEISVHGDGSPSSGHFGLRPS